MTILLLSIPAAWLLWVIFTAAMRLQQVRDEGKLTLAMKVLGYPTIAFGLVIDFLVNAILGTIVFMEIPREWTLSARLWRWSNEGSGYRQKWAIAIRAQLLDAIDPSGTHRG